MQARGLRVRVHVVDSRSFPRLVAAALVFLLDLLGAAAALIVLVTIVAGPWTITIGGHLLRARSTGNLIVGFLLVAALRTLAPERPLLAVRGWSLPEVRRTAAAWLAALSRRLDAVDARTALRVVGILIVVASAIRVANVFTHFGFVTGDDVEIHEMTLGVALGKAWPVWEIRNAFYPMTFVFPVQRALVALGVTDVFSLVAAGRLFVTAIAALNVWILYRVGLSLSGDRGTALLAAGLLAVNHLHMAYGSAELPRIVATAFLVPAFGVLLTPTPMRCAFAGILVGSARRCATARSCSLPFPPCCRFSVGRAPARPVPHGVFASPRPRCSSLASWPRSSSRLACRTRCIGAGPSTACSRSSTSRSCSGCRRAASSRRGST